MFDIAILISCITICGIIILLLLNNNKLSNYVIFSYPLGSLIYFILFFILDKLSIKYNSYINLGFLIILIISLLLCSIKKKVKLKNDLKQIPIYFYIFIIYLFIKLIMSANYSLFAWFNWDEFSGFQYGSKISSLDNFLSINMKKIMQAPFTITMGYYYRIFIDNIYILRMITPLYFVLIAIYMNIKMINMNVNKHISSLITLVFITSAPEFILMSSTYYNNIYCIFYFFTGFSILLEYLLSDDNKNNLILSLLLLVCSILTRNEIFYLLVAFLILITIYFIIVKRKEKVKCFKYLLTIIIVYVIWNLFLNTYPITSSLGIDFSINEVLERLEWSNLKLFLNSMRTQLFNISGFYIFTTFIISVLSFIFLVYMIYKKRIKNKEYYLFILLMQFIYFNLIIATELVVFQRFEYLVAASFSRYILLIMPFSFLILGKLIKECINEKGVQDEENFNNNTSI